MNLLYPCLMVPPTLILMLTTCCPGPGPPQAATSRLQEADRELADLSRQVQERGADDEQLRALLHAAQDQAREAREGEVTAKNVNRELHKMCER